MNTIEDAPDIFRFLSTATMTGFSSFEYEMSLLSAICFLVFAVGAIFTVAIRLCCLMLGVSKVDGKQSWNNYHILSCALLLILACEFPSWLTTPGEGLADLIQGTDPKLNEILARVPAIRQGPAPPLLFQNRHVQFIPWLIQNEIHRVQGIPFQRIDVHVTDCADKMVGCDQAGSIKMNDTVTIDVFPPFDSESPYGEGFNKSSPVILFAPGLRCYSQDMPGNMIIRKAYEHGIRSIVVNRRGHTPNQLLKSPRWSLFGDVDDMEQVYWYIKDELVTQDTPFFLHGISSGTAVTVSALAKWDKRRQEYPERKVPVFVGAIDVTPGYDTSKVLRRERFQWPYNDLLVFGVADHFVRQNEELLRSYDSDAVDKMLSASSLQEFVDAGVTFAGYKNTTLFYQETNPVNQIADITTPTLVLNAADDPCCKIDNLYEQSPYPQHGGKTYDQMIRETERGMVAVAHTGSHIPFICSRDRWLPFVQDPLYGGWMLNSWGDQVSIEYYLAALEVYGDRRFL